MSYKNIFDDTESLVHVRLKEMPGDEVETIKQAGYNSVWTNFLEGFFQSGWEDTAKQASLLDLGDGVDPFVLGQKEAMQDIAQADPYTLGWYSFLKEAYDANKKGASLQEFCKEAQLSLEEESTLEAAGFLAASEHVLESEHDLVKIAWNGPNNIMEINQMSAFEFGKEAAFDELLGYADNGASVAEILEIVDITVNQDIDKYASEEESDFRLGIETMCHGLVKTAGDIYGTYDTSDSTEGEILLAVFEKLAGFDQYAVDAYQNEDLLMGKEAAFNQISDMSWEGASIDDVFAVVQNTLEAPLDKYASEGDMDFTLGVESMCHEFLKVASEVYAEYDLSDAYETDIIEFVLDKIAAENMETNVSGYSDAERAAANAKYNPKLKQKGEDGKTKRNPKQKQPKAGKKPKLTEKDKKLRRSVRSIPDKEKEGKRGQTGIASKLKADPSIGEAGKQGRTMQERVGDARKATGAFMGRHGKGIAGGALAAGGLLAAGAGARHLYKKRQANREEKEATASLADPRVLNALAVLEDAGLLDD